MGQNFEVGNDGRMKLKSFASDPSGSEGMLIYNTTMHRLRFYNGTQWVNA